MKIKYLSLLAAVMGASLSFGASISNLDPSYTKDGRDYDGITGDTLNVSSPTTIDYHGAGNWTMALTVSGLSVTQTGKTGLLFTYNTASYQNIGGLGYQLTDDGALTLCVGGFAYNGGTNASSPWKTQAFSSYSKENPQPLTIFYSYAQGAVSISAMWGNNENTLTTLTSLGKSSGVQFSNNDITKINFSAKDTTGSTWTVPNGVTGDFTLNNFDVYTSKLTETQMKEYAVSAVPAVPEPAAASLGLLGLVALMMRRRRQA